MRRNTLSEKDFLKEMLIVPFNFYKGTKLKRDDVNIRSILPVPGYRLGYELTTKRRDDYFKIKAYLNINRGDSLTPFELQLEGATRLGELGDEVFVTYGTIDSAHHLYGGYPFQWIDDLNAGIPLLIQTNGLPFLLTNGGFIKLT